MCLISLQKFRATVRDILFKLKIRKPKAFKGIDLEKSECDALGDSIIDLRTRSSSIKSVIPNRNSSISDYYSVANDTSSERDNIEDPYECSYGFGYGIYDDCYGDISFSTKKKRFPNTGSNFSKIPILSEIPKIINPAAWVSSKTQKDTKSIKN